MIDFSVLSHNRCSFIGVHIISKICSNPNWGNIVNAITNIIPPSNNSSIQAQATNKYNKQSRDLTYIQSSAFPHYCSAYMWYYNYVNIVYCFMKWFHVVIWISTTFCHGKVVTSFLLCIWKYKNTINLFNLPSTVIIIWKCDSTSLTSSVVIQ